MSTHASVWTPRHTHRLWPRKKEYKAPKAQPYVAPPPPPPLKKPPPPAAQHIAAETLVETADELIQQAEELNTSALPPSLKIQLGTLLLSTEQDMIKKILKDWDSKGKGEFLKGEFRLNLRMIGLNATSSEADGLFDSWDNDKGGSLDLKELRAALVKCANAAQDYRDTPDPNTEKAALLRKRAKLAREAAAVTQEAEEMEAKFEEFVRETKARADYQLGALLEKRRIKPGAVVTSWAKSRGAHQGELSKKDFREAVIELGVPKESAGQIDAVFDSFDGDGGGYMDADEAAAMVKALLAVGTQAEAEMRRKGAESRAVRGRASKKASLALAPLTAGAPSPAPAAAPAPAPAPARAPAPAPAPGSRGKAKGGAKGKSKSPRKVGSSLEGSSKGGGMSDGQHSNGLSVGTSSEAEDAFDLRGPLKRAPAVAIATAIGRGIDAIGGLFSDRGKRDKVGVDCKPALSETLSETLSDSQRAELTARFVSILQHFLSSRALRQWHWISTRQKHAIAELRAGLLAFRNPQLRKGFSTWRGAHEDALKARQTLALGSSQIVKLELRRGYRAFERVLAKARRKRELEVRCEAVMRHFIRPRMQLPFNLWHEQQMATEMERKLKEGLCCALGYWLRTSCGRCACRQIPVPPQTARKLRSEGVWWI